jgi:hypothetical protein
MRATSSDRELGEDMADQTVTTIHGIKGFDLQLRCTPNGKPFQFAIGETYRHDGPVRVCSSGFHAVTGYPLAVLAYYPAAGSRFCRVEQSGAMSSDDGEKTASEILKVGREIGLSELIQDAVTWVMDRSKPEGETATGYGGAASSTGYGGAASSTGVRGAASSTGVRGAASSTGDGGAASSTGDGGAAMASGYEGRVMGADGCALFAVERGDWDGKGYPIMSVACGIVGRDGIEPGAWYRAKDGKLVDICEANSAVPAEQEAE